MSCSMCVAIDGTGTQTLMQHVVEGGLLSEGKPLWWRDARRELPKEWLEEWDRKITALDARTMTNISVIKNPVGIPVALF